MFFDKTILQEIKFLIDNDRINCTGVCYAKCFCNWY